MEPANKIQYKIDSESCDDLERLERMFFKLKNAPERFIKV